MKRLIACVEEVQTILADDGRAVILGALASENLRHRKDHRDSFAIILTIANLEIARFQMLEDSFAVSRAARLR